MTLADRTLLSKGGDAAAWTLKQYTSAFGSPALYEDTFVAAWWARLGKRWLPFVRIDARTEHDLVRFKNDKIETVIEVKAWWPAESHDARWKWDVDVRKLRRSRGPRYFALWMMHRGTDWREKKDIDSGRTVKAWYQRRRLKEAGPPLLVHGGGVTTSLWLWRV